MSSLQEKLKSDLTDAQKSRDASLVSTLRYLLASVMNREIELRPLNKEMTDGDVLDVISKQIKQRRESIEEFKKASRQELVDKEQHELEILESYLPKQLSESELEKLVTECIEEVGAKGISEMGKIMSILTPKVKGLVDMSKVSNLVKSKLVG